MDHIEIRVILNKHMPYAMLEVLNRLRQALEKIQADHLVDDFGIAVSVISKSLVQACNEATEKFAKKLATEPSP